MGEARKDSYEILGDVALSEALVSARRLVKLLENPAPGSYGWVAVVRRTLDSLTAALEGV